MTRATQAATGHYIKPGMHIHHSTTSDIPALAALFTASVHALAADHYDTAQRAAWAPQPPDPAYWHRRLNGLHTLVAHINGQPAGFIAYASNGHIDLLFTAPAHARRGVGSTLYKQTELALVKDGVSNLFTEASRVARPFFAYHGFQAAQAQHVYVRGVLFRRFAMRKWVNKQASE